MDGSSIQKGESLEDTLRTVAALGAVAAAVRTGESFALRNLPDLALSLINAGDGWSEHPTQMLSDLLAVDEAVGDVAGRTLLIVGDILHSRVARSAAEAFSTLGARVLFAGPPTLVPQGLPEALGGERVALEPGLRLADMVMALRLQRERQERGYLPSLAEYRRFWGLTAERLRLLPPHAVVLHPGPQNRGVEIDADVMTCPRSLIAEQITCGVYMRAAALEAMLDAR